MAVRFGSDARAYPIVQMAYHHVFNDEVGGIPSSSRIERFVTPVWCGKARRTDGCCTFIWQESTIRIF